MKYLKVSAVCFLLFFVMKADKCNESRNSSFSKSDCPFERLDWMTVSEGYKSSTVIDLAAKFEAAAKADAAVLKGAEGSASASFASSLKSAIDNSSSAKTEV